MVKNQYNTKGTAHPLNAIFLQVCYEKLVIVTVFIPFGKTLFIFLIISKYNVNVHYLINYSF